MVKPIETLEEALAAIEALRAQAKRFQAKFLVLDKRAVDAGEAAAQAEQEHNTRRKRLSRERDELRKQINQLQDRIAALEGELVRARDENARLRASCCTAS